MLRTPATDPARPGRGPCAPVLLLALVALGAGCAPAPLPDHLAGWNVLLLTLDTTRQDHLGCYGAKGARTRHLDRLAASGVVFDHAVAQAPITLPSHASILTGKNPPEHGVRGNGVYALPASEETLAEILGEAGYATAAVVAAYVLDRRFGLAQGFGHYDDDPAAMRASGVNDPSRPAAAVTSAALAAARALPGDRPFFLWVHYFDPHHPYAPPEPFASSFPPTREGRYRGEIAAMDAAIGDLLAGLEDLGKLRRTLVVAVADHGEGTTGPHAETTHGLLLYDETIRIPLIVTARGGLPGGRREGGLARQVDLVPTLLDLLEIDAAGRGFAGVSLRGRLQGAPPKRAPLAFAETFLGYDAYGWSPLFSVRSRDWKYVEGPRAELYDLVHDPIEATNVAADHPERVDRMARDLVRLRGGARPSDGRFARVLGPRAEDAERLRALGYVESAAEPASIPPLATLRHPADSIHLFERLDEARFLKTNGRPREALAKGKALLEEDPTNYLALAHVAECSTDLERYEEAERYYRRMAGLRPNDPGPHAALGTARLRHCAALGRDGRNRSAREQESAAYAAFRRAVELGTVELAPYVHLGRERNREERYAEAIELLERAVRIDARHARARYLLGFALARSGRADEAVEHLDVAFEHAPSDDVRLDVQLLRAEACLRSGATDRAAEHFEWVLREHPSHPRAAEVRAALERIEERSP